MTTIRARSRCALPMSLEFHPVIWLHIPPKLETVAADNFHGWSANSILKALASIMQRLGGRKQGQQPFGLRYPYLCDTSRMFGLRSEHRPDNAAMLATVTCWTRPELVNQAIYQRYRKLNAPTQLISYKPSTKTMPMSKLAPPNPKMALQVFLELLSKHKKKLTIALRFCGSHPKIQKMLRVIQKTAY